MLEFRISSQKKARDILKGKKIPLAIIKRFKKEKGASWERSLLGRCLVFKCMELDEDFFLLFLETSLCSYFFQNIFWSLSYKDNFIGVGVSDKKIGIDVEVNKKRDEDLLHLFSRKEWNVVGEKTWENFYKIWTSKEAFIKLSTLSLSDMKSLSIVKQKEDKILIKYKEKEFETRIFEEGEVIGSICTN